MTDEAKRTMEADGADPEGAAGADGAPDSLSSPQLEELRAKAAKADELWNQVLRLSADFDNFRKRAARERQEAIKFANEALLERLVPVLDNFEMALQAATDAQSASIESLRTGVTMIHSQLRSVMNEAGLEEINAAGESFDPNFHEAVAQKEAPDVEEGTVVQQLRKGYKLRDRLLRPATVVVARKSAS